MDNSGKIIAAVLLGAAVGAVTGLLLAPEKGERTRRKFNETAHNILDDLEIVLEESADLIKDLADDALAEIEKYTKKVDDSLNKS